MMSSPIQTTPIQVDQPETEQINLTVSSADIIPVITSEQVRLYYDKKDNYDPINLIEEQLNASIDYVEKILTSNNSYSRYERTFAEMYIYSRFYGCTYNGKDQVFEYIDRLLAQINL